MFFEKYRIGSFDISPYPMPRDDEYFYLMANQWHIALPWEYSFANSDEKEKYEKQFEDFLAYVGQCLETDLASGKYRDYMITSADGSFCGIVDAGTIYFDKPEVGLMLKPEYRSKGIGYMIMKDFIQKVKESTGADKVIWRTEKDNTAAICLALKLGGRESFCMEDYKCFEI